MQVAIVSTDGINVDDHFGKAARFLIYEINDEKSTLLKTRDSTPLSENDPKHPFNERKFNHVLGNLEGCIRMYCTKIGDRPAEELKKAGIEPVIYDGPISAIKI